MEKVNIKGAKVKYIRYDIHKNELARVTERACFWISASIVSGVLTGSGLTALVWWGVS